MKMFKQFEKHTNYDVMVNQYQKAVNDVKDAIKHLKLNTVEPEKLLMPEFVDLILCDYSGSNDKRRYFHEKALYHYFVCLTVNETRKYYKRLNMKANQLVKQGRNVMNYREQYKNFKKNERAFEESVKPLMIYNHRANINESFKRRRKNEKRFPAAYCTTADIKRWIKKCSFWFDSADDYCMFAVDNYPVMSSSGSRFQRVGNFQIRKNIPVDIVGYKFKFTDCIPDPTLIEPDDTLKEKARLFRHYCSETLQKNMNKYRKLVEHCNANGTLKEFGVYKASEKADRPNCEDVYPVVSLYTLVNNMQEVDDIEMMCMIVVACKYRIGVQNRINYYETFKKKIIEAIVKKGMPENDPWVQRFVNSHFDEIRTKALNSSRVLNPLDKGDFIRRKRMFDEIGVNCKIEKV